MIDDTLIIDTLSPLITDAKDFQSYLSPQRIKWNNAYLAKPYGNEREGWSTTVHPTIMDTIEWIKPYLYEIFTGDFFAVSGGEANSASLLKKYLRFKLFTETSTEDEIDSFLHYALASHYGIFKVVYVDEYHYEGRQLGNLNQMQFDELGTLSEEGISTTKFDEVEGYDPIEMKNKTDYENVKALQRVQDYKGPKVTCVPPTELYMSQGYVKLEDCPLVAHVVKRSLDYVKKRERDGIYRKGSYEKVKNRLATLAAEQEVEAEVDDRYAANGMPSPDIEHYTTDLNEGNAEVLIWECYCKLDIDGDGFLEDAIITLCEDVVLQDPIENEYRTPPFELGYANSQPHNMLGRPFTEIMAGWQKVMTNMQRSVQDAAIISTKRGWFTDSVNAQDALRDWYPGDCALTDKGANIQQIDFGNPTDFLFKAYEQISSEKDKNSGVNEAVQGMDKDAMNKTASGMEMKLNASQSRQRLYARRLSRTFGRVLRRFIDILRLHPPEDDINVLGQDIQIDQIDFEGNYFVNIDVGVGPQENRGKAQLMDAHLQFLAKAGIEMGVANQTHVIKTITRKGNYLDIDMSDLIFTEEEFAEFKRMQQGRQ